MATTKLSALPLVLFRLFLAWMVGGVLYFVTSVVTAYDGFNTFVSGIIGGAFISAACVAACAVIGLLLLIPFVKRFWRATYFPALGLFAFGFLMFVFGLLPSQIKTVGHDEYGSSIEEVGMTWVVGYLLLIFAIANFPYTPKLDSQEKVA